MAVEASNLKFFLPHHVQDSRDVMIDPCVEGIGDSGNDDLMLFSGSPFLAGGQLSGPKTSMNDDSGLTCNFMASRKRSMEMYAAAVNFPPPQKGMDASLCPSLIGDGLSSQLQQHQLEIDAIVSQHTKRVRLELAERQKQQARLLAAAIAAGVARKLKEKEDQIQRMCKLNFALQDRVKSLYVENQLWREVAKTNEAAANSLRSDLEHVLAAHVSAQEDVESCCGSSSDPPNDAEEVVEAPSLVHRTCRRCGERESCVLLLPCRHLCLCNICGSGSHKLQSCPVCNSSVNATLHVNISS